MVVDNAKPHTRAV